MNVLKNFEAVFVMALGVAAGASYFVQSADAAANPAAAVAAATAMSTMMSTTMSTTNIATPSTMAVVTVAGKRMSAIEKQRSLEDERRLVQGAPTRRFANPLFR